MLEKHFPNHTNYDIKFQSLLQTYKVSIPSSDLLPRKGSKFNADEFPRDPIIGYKPVNHNT